jgi:hypothetical protein
MTQNKNRIGRSSATGQFIVGAKASIHISKVEGLSQSRDMKTMFRDFDRKGILPDARRIALMDKYGKKGG